MAKCGITNISGGGGIGSDELSVTKEYVLNGKTYVGADTNDEIGAGTMVDNKTTSNQNLNASGSFIVKKGYHEQDFTVAANSLASQTPGTVTADKVLNSFIYWSNGSKGTGTMPDYSKTPSPIDAIRMNNNRFEVAVVRGFHGYSWDSGGYEYMTYAQVASTIGLKSENVREGITYVGVPGSMKDYSYLAVGQTSF